MEALSVAANFTAIAGIAGQVAQGCAYLYTIFDDARDAPKDPQNLKLELRVIEQIVILTSDQETQALAFCLQAIMDLRADVEKYADVEGGRRMRKWGRKLEMAFRKEKIWKHVEALRSAKTHLIDARIFYAPFSVVF